MEYNIFQKGIDLIDNIETLAALAKFKTMTKAATTLRVSQSTVSKRIAFLENLLERKLIEQEGRNVFLTKEALHFLDQVSPHVAGIKDAINGQHERQHLNLKIGFSESILSSWGGRILSELYKAHDPESISPHSHRGPMVIDRVRSGEYLFGLCAGHCEKASDLTVLELGFEQMVILSSKRNLAKPLMSIEPNSETWQAIHQQANLHNVIPDKFLEFFTPIVQLANNGAFNGLVPIGVAKEFRKKGSVIKRTKLKRPIILIARKTTFLREDLSPFIEQFKDLITSQLRKING